MSENKEEKTYKYELLVETIFTRPKMAPGEGWVTNIDTRLVSFKGDNYDHVRQDAEKEMDRTIRYGMTLKGGAIIKSQILPSAIYQVGIVDYNKFIQEKAEMDAQQTPEQEVIAALQDSPDLEDLAMMPPEAFEEAAS